MMSMALVDTAVGPWLPEARLLSAHFGTRIQRKHDHAGLAQRSAGFNAVAATSRRAGPTTAA